MKRNGFSFIELIISVTIFAIIMAAVYSAFNMGIKVWRRGQDRRVGQKIRLGFLKIEKELKDTFFFSRIPFKGTHQGMTFPLSIPRGDTERTYVITYSIEVDEGTGLSELTRKEKVFPEELEEDGGTIKGLLPPTTSIGFEYAYRSNVTSKNLEWQDAWSEERQNKLPAGVKITLQMDDSGEVYNKVVFLQVGNLGAI